MKEAVVKQDLRVDIIDTEVPKPRPDQVLIRVVVSGCNPKDWKYPFMFGKELNQGDDIAGIVEAVGENVSEFKHGDRVAGFHEMGTAGGSYAEYAISWQHTCFHIPKQISFEEAATFPLAAMTAAIGLYAELKLPSPWTPPPPAGAQQEKNKKPLPLVIYGAASAVGAFAIQFAQKSNIHPIIAVAGRGEAFVETLIDRSKGDTIVDYRRGDEAVVQGIKDALKGEKLHYAFDAIGEHNSYVNIAKVLEPGQQLGHITIVLPINEEKVLEQFDSSMTYVGKVHNDENYKDFGFVYFRAIGFGMQQGWLKAHPQEVVNGGLAGVKAALGNLKDGKASAVKYVFRIAETPGLS